MLTYPVLRLLNSLGLLNFSLACVGFNITLLGMSLNHQIIEFERSCFDSVSKILGVQTVSFDHFSFSLRTVFMLPWRLQLPASSLSLKMIYCSKKRCLF